MNARLPAQKNPRTRDLLTTLRNYEMQAQLLKAAYGAAMAPNGMLYWLAEAARDLREQKGRMLSHVAASASVDQSTIYRFESHMGAPRRLDAVVAAYADDLELQPIDIWTHALSLWSAAHEADQQVSESEGVVAGVSVPLQETARSQRSSAREQRQNPGATRRHNSA